jgi:hypothetical protein
MSGLYQRTLEIYRQKNGLRLVSRGESGGALEEIPAEERENILREIDGILVKNRVEAAPQNPKAGRSGLALPFIVNLIIVAAVATTVLLFTKALNGQEEQLASGAREIKGAESQVFVALREESAAQIGQKDQEIVAFQTKLAQATAERERVRSQAAEDIQKREKELAAEMAASLEAERRRLQGSGIRADRVDEQLRVYEERLKAETLRQTDAFQKKATEEAARSEAAVNSLISEYQKNLDLVQADRSRLQQQYLSKESDLKRQYARESATLQDEKNQAQSDLSRLQETRRQEGLVMGRLLESYDEINRQVGAGENAAALESLGALRESLDREPAASLALIRSRRPVELFIIGSLEQLIRSRMERDKGDAAALIDTKARIEALREKAAQAEAQYQGKNYAAARGLYASALAEIPEAKASYERLDAMVQAEHRSQLEAIRLARAGIVAQVTRRFETGEWQPTLDRYRQALGLLIEDQAMADSLVAHVAEAGYRLGTEKDAARRALIPDRMKGLRQELLLLPPSAVEENSQEFASLLQAKLLMWQIIGTEPIKTRYPEIYDTLQKYFDTLASQQRQEGRNAALADIISLIESLRKGTEAARDIPASDRGSLIRLLEGLEGLIRE